MEDMKSRIARIQEEIRKPLTTKSWQGYEPKDRKPKQKFAHCKTCDQRLPALYVQGVDQFCDECREARRYVDAYNTQRPRSRRNSSAVIRTNRDYDGGYFD